MGEQTIVLEGPALFDIDKVLTLTAPTHDARSELRTDADRGSAHVARAYVTASHCWVVVPRCGKLSGGKWAQGASRSSSEAHEQGNAAVHTDPGPIPASCGFDTSIHAV